MDSFSTKRFFVHDCFSKYTSTTHTCTKVLLDLSLVPFVTNLSSVHPHFKVRSRGRFRTSFETSNMVEFALSTHKYKDVVSQEPILGGVPLVWVSMKDEWRPPKSSDPVSWSPLPTSVVSVLCGSLVRPRVSSSCPLESPRHTSWFFRRHL